MQKHAQTLRSQEEPDIDNLTTIVSESVEAYKVCKERIDAVEKALEQRSATPDRRQRRRERSETHVGLGRPSRRRGRRPLLRFVDIGLSQHGFQEPGKGSRRLDAALLTAVGGTCPPPHDSGGNLLKPA